MPVKAQSFDQATVAAHLQEMYRQHGDRLYKWKGPIYYIAAGFESEATNRLIEKQFAYFRDLTGLDIQNAMEAGRKGNFVLVFADPLTSIADLKTIRAVFGKEGQSDADYRKMLEELDRDGVSRSITKRTKDAIAFYAQLTNPASWKDDEIASRVFKLIAGGLTQAHSSDTIRPSIFNTDGGFEPKSRLPTIDELYLRNLYSDSIAPGQTLERGLDRLSAAITFDLID